MKQHEFKFGDMVQHPEFGRGVIVAAFDHSIDVIFENNRTIIRTISLSFLSELELVPNLDTVRLNWLIKQLTVSSPYESLSINYPNHELVELTRNFLTTDDPTPIHETTVIGSSEHPNYRQAIDKAMQEQTP